jgi:hypothetical protein
MVIGCRAPIGWRVDGKRDVDALGDQHGGVALGAQGGEPLVVGALRLGARDVDPLAGVRPVRLGQRTQGLASQRDRRAVAEMLGLGAGQFVQIGGQVEGMLGRADRLWPALRPINLWADQPPGDHRR